ncbi:hematopoietic progenitor cell antigen CD34 [Lacerta agilis]|uniref:hematopoietic progenitor cell antigen CD34 n=1 Tax=Lacerta agilis TaxID=80427 RepID=UPI00141933FA|nr:hematopoietic progenitor cell antigen CD34 [Lacerta agilis]
MLQWSFKVLEERHLFWTVFCALSLLAAGDTANSTTAPASESPSAVIPSNTTQLLTSSSTTELPPGNFSISTTKSTDQILSTETTNGTNVTSPEALTTKPTSNTTVQASPTQGSSRNETIQNTTSTPLLTSTSTELPKHTFSNIATTTEAGDSTAMVSITCLNIKNVMTTEVICLEINEEYSCHQFKKQKGMDLRNAVCEENPSQCHIKLSESEVKRNCILLVEAANKGPSALETVLQQKATFLEQLGIKPHKQEDISSHKDYSRKTLIALVTSGLLLAFLGLAAYFLMKRQSWSPMGERLGEDTYYTENDSHGNTVVSVASHEQSDLQDKPNFNGGARENGTGQPTSKNGHSTKPHVVADTEL